MDTMDLPEAVETVAAFEGPDGLSEEIGIDPTTDCWVEEALMRTHYVEE